MRPVPTSQSLTPSAPSVARSLASELKAPWMGWRGGMLRAVRATMEGRFDEAEQLAAEARRAGKAAGDPVVDTIWTTNREALLRAAERHDELAAFEPDVCRARAALHLAPFWQSLQSIMRAVKSSRAWRRPIISTSRALARST